jgi:hypothetical protein
LFGRNRYSVFASPWSSVWYQQPVAGSIALASCAKRPMSTIGTALAAVTLVSAGTSKT